MRCQYCGSSYLPPRCTHCEVGLPPLSEWADNPGHQPTPGYTLVDVEFFNGKALRNVRATALNWSKLNENGWTIKRWRYSFGDV